MSTKGRYGLIAMVFIAMNQQEEYIPLNLIAERQNISQNYLSQIFFLLRGANLVKSVRGFQGGYSLARKASEIYVGDILRVIEGETNLANIHSHNDIEERINIAVWENIDKQINSVLYSITLEQLASSEGVFFLNSIN
ncbi:Rrf2 family transcriptional regulator [Clostridium intestinale]|uniref:RrF2 family transcriptional regulator n=1 Tax=Clostridium intestinale TaxID=36845 RepID=UPI002DD675AD|nr:Rrf2 family transcriptional regulator [Clostridium intestinale]WRY54038.1 Rrf2 family transcriptional regulator [Clostridium intestinale]